MCPEHAQTHTRTHTHTPHIHNTHTFLWTEAHKRPGVVKVVNTFGWFRNGDGKEVES